MAGIDLVLSIVLRSSSLCIRFRATNLLPWHPRSNSTDFWQKEAASSHFWSVSISNNLSSRGMHHGNFIGGLLEDGRNQLAQVIIQTFPLLLDNKGVRHWGIKSQQPAGTKNKKDISTTTVTMCGSDFHGQKAWPQTQIMHEEENVTGWTKHTNHTEWQKQGLDLIQDPVGVPHTQIIHEEKSKCGKD